MCTKEILYCGDLNILDANNNKQQYGVRYSKISITETTWQP